MLHSKQWHYSLHRDFQNCYSTRRSLTRFFKAPIPAPILHVHITENSTCRRQRALRVLQSSSRNSTHRRQGDLLEMHPCVLQDIQGNSSCSRDIQDIPVIHDLPAFQAILQCSSISRESTPFQHFQLECIFYSSIGFHRNSTEYQLGNYRHYKHYIQRKGDVAISVKMSR